MGSTPSQYKFWCKYTSNCPETNRLTPFHQLHLSTHLQHSDRGAAGWCLSPKSPHTQGQVQTPARAAQWTGSGSATLSHHPEPSPPSGDRLWREPWAFPSPSTTHKIGGITSSREAGHVMPAYTCLYTHTRICMYLCACALQISFKSIVLCLKSCLSWFRRKLWQNQILVWEMGKANNNVEYSKKNLDLSLSFQLCAQASIFLKIIF